jgi:hypothetical protein
MVEGVATLPSEERELTTPPYGFSSGRDDLARHCQSKFYTACSRSRGGRQAAAIAVAFTKLSDAVADFAVASS